MFDLRQDGPTEAKIWFEDGSFLKFESANPQANDVILYFSIGRVEEEELIIGG